MKRRKILIIAFCIVAAGVAVYAIWGRHAASQQTSQSEAQPQNQVVRNTTPDQTDQFDKTAHSLSDPASIWIIVNKQHPLQPKSFAPGDLVLPNVSQRLPGQQQMKMRAPAAAALETMLADAQKAGYKLEISTAYRSYSYQQTLYNSYVATDGQSAADTSSARPGYSEHQTGLAVDLQPANGQCHLEACFGTLPEGKWLAGNAYKYGFLLRYPPGKEVVTGYKYEPWHFRYIGTDLSNELYKAHVETLEEFFNVSGGTTYK